MHYTNYTNNASAAPKLYQLNYVLGGIVGGGGDVPLHLSPPSDFSISLTLPLPLPFYLPDSISILFSVTPGKPLRWPESVTEMLYTDKQQISIVCNLARLLLLLLCLGELAKFQAPFLHASTLLIPPTRRQLSLSAGNNRVFGDGLHKRLQLVSVTPGTVLTRNSNLLFN